MAESVLQRAAGQEQAGVLPSGFALHHLQYTEDDMHELAHRCAADRYLGLARLGQSLRKGANQRRCRALRDARKRRQEPSPSRRRPCSVGALEKLLANLFVLVFGDGTRVEGFPKVLQFPALRYLCRLLDLHDSVTTAGTESGCNKEDHRCPHDLCSDYHRSPPVRCHCTLSTSFLRMRSYSLSFIAPVS